MATGTFEGSNVVLLWTNPSPASSFAGQTIPLDLLNYDAVIVLTAMDTSASGQLVVDSLITPVGYGSRSVIQWNVRYIRQYEVSTSGVSFNDGAKGNVGANASTDNTVGIPYQIYGIRKL